MSEASASGTTFQIPSSNDPKATSVAGLNMLRIISSERERVGYH